MRLPLALLLLFASAPVLGSEASDLAGRVVAAYGGAETIERNKIRRQSGTLESNRHGKTGTVERVYSRPYRLRIDIRIPGEAPESRILDGERGWRDGKEVPPMMAKAMLLQAARLDLPYLIMAAGPGLKPLGPVKNDGGHDLRALEIPMRDGLRLMAVIDAKTGYIVNSRGLIQLGAGQGMEFVTYYAGHKEMNGMVVATKELHFAQGQRIGKTILDKSETVPALPGTVFRP